MCSLINVYVIEKLFADAAKVKLRAPVSIIKFLIKLRELFLKDALVIGEGWENAAKKWFSVWVRFKQIHKIPIKL